MPIHTDKIPAKFHTIEKELLKEMADGLSAVIDGRLKEFHACNITPQMVEQHLKPLGWKRGDLDSNGWQYDWWLPFTKGKKSFTASGSGFYGDFGFQKTDE